MLRSPEIVLLCFGRGRPGHEQITLRRPEKSPQRRQEVAISRAGRPMTSLPRRFWQDMTTREFEALDAARVIALLPVGAIEQHGPHLPVAVDACINAGIVARALELVPADLPVTVLPLLPVGKSDEHLAFPGTLTLAAETLARLWTEIGESVARAGVRKLVLFNSHGGQPQVMEIVARDLRVRLGMMVVAYSWYAAGVPAGLFPDDEVRHGIHAGAIETSIMLHLRPDLVQMDQAADFAPLMRQMAADGYRLLSPTGPGKLAWQAQDLHPSGAAGDARNADAERGRALVDHAARALGDLLREVDRFPPDRLRSR
jgi:creatinine amidohydrolase